MAELSIPEIADYAYAAGFRGAELNWSVAIAMAESDGGHTDAHALTKKEDSRGLWQINVRAHPQYANVDLYDPATNARAAFDVKKRQGWGAWSVTKNGRAVFWLPTVATTLGTNYVGKLPSNVIGAGAGAVESVVGPQIAGVRAGIETINKVGQWITTPANILRIMYVGIGAVLVVGALVVLSRPVTEPAAKAVGKAADIAL